MRNKTSFKMGYIAICILIGCYMVAGLFDIFGVTS